MIRTRICLYILLLAPLLTYYQTVFHGFGFRSDYTHLREAREEPGKLVKFTASNGRPLYGALLETSYAETGDVSNLPWLRLTTVALLTVLGLGVWRQLYQSGWTEIQAAAIGLGVVLLPAAQVTVGWAACWPQVLALLLALAGFSAIETELERGGMKRIVALVGGGMIYMLAGLIYQSNVLFALVPIAAVLLVRGGREMMSDQHWLTMHLATLLAGLVGSYLIVKSLFSNGVFQESVRMQLEGDVLGKLVWFVWQPLPNALALYRLRDSFDPAAWQFWSMVALTLLLIGLGVKSATKETPKIKWQVCLVVLPFLAHGVSLMAAERATGYRTTFALSGLVLVLVMFALRSMLAAGWIKQWMHYTALGLFTVGTVLSASHNAFSLLAEPQGYEWDTVLSPVMRTTFKGPTKVYIITDTLADRSTNSYYADEFGSVSGDTEAVAMAMFRCAVRERLGPNLPKAVSFTITVGRESPASGAHDLVIDMRKLSKWRVQ